MGSKVHLSWNCVQGLKIIMGLVKKLKIIRMFSGSYNKTTNIKMVPTRYSKSHVLRIASL